MKLLLNAISLLLLMSCNSTQEKLNSAAPPDETNKNIQLVKSVFNDLVAKQNYALVDSFFAPNIFDHGALDGQEQGLAGFKKAVTEFLGLFSHIEVNIEAVMAEGDLVSSRETWKITRAADKKILTGETMHWFRIKEGRITDEWSQGWNFLGM